MANTYTQIYIHIVFAILVRDRTLRSLIWFVTLRRDRSGFINDRRWVAGRCSWQEGFGSFP
jgi:hypothetical protein